MKRPKKIQPSYEIVVFSDDWFGLPFSCKHLFKHFPPHIPILWVETIGLRSPSFNFYDFKRAGKLIRDWLKKNPVPGNNLPENLRIVNPLQIPYNHIPIVRSFNQRKMIKNIGNLTNNKSSRKRVILTTWPFLGGLFGKLNEDLTVYYRVDDFSEFPGVRRDLIQTLEVEIIQKADMVIASSENLTFLPYGHKAFYLPHGVDYEHFTKQDKDSRTGSVISAIPHPIIGFFGLLNSWLDLEVIDRVAALHKQWSFVFIGPSQMPESQLPRRENIYYIGPLSYEVLPAVATNFDVGLIPFRINKLTLAVNPLKLLEYFALGLPVVSTPLPEVVKLGNLVHIGNDENSLSIAISNALQDTTLDAVSKRQQIAKTNSWQLKAIQLRKLLEEAINTKTR